MSPDLNSWTCDRGAVSGPEACNNCPHKCEARAQYPGQHSTSTQRPNLLPNEVIPIVIDNRTGVGPLLHAVVNWLVA